MRVLAEINVPDAEDCRMCDFWWHNGYMCAAYQEREWPMRSAYQPCEKCLQARRKAAKKPDAMDAALKQMRRDAMQLLVNDKIRELTKRDERRLLRMLREDEGVK